MTRSSIRHPRRSRSTYAALLRTYGCAVTLGLSAVGVLVANAPEAGAQTPVRHACRCAEDMPIPVRGEVRALIVFLRFVDDTYNNPCTDGAKAWPHESAMPTFAEDLLAADPAPPFPERSLTQLFFQQSNGNFVITGEVVGYVTKLPREAYVRTGARRASDILDHGRITEEALRALDATIDYRSFDGNGDGYPDQVFFVARSTSPYHVAIRNADGVSTLGFSVPPGGEDFDGMGFCSNCSGSFNRYQGMDPQWRLLALLAHEYGHDLFNGPRYYGGHLDPITGNMVPFVPHADSLGSAYADRTTGYALMLGHGSQRHEANTNAFLSAYERALISLGAETPEARWIECPALTRDTTVTLGDLVATGDCVRHEYERLASSASPRGRRPQTPSVEALYLSNLQQATYFTQPSTTRTTVSRSCDGCRTVPGGGPHDTGLLVERTARQDTAPYRAQRDVLPADNGMTALLTCEQLTVGEGVEAAEVYDGDLWDPHSVQQLTPWTRPNSFGTTFQRDIPVGLRAGPWPAFDALRYAAEPTASQQAPAITFDYVRDLRYADTVVIRSDSWMDRGSDGLTLSGTLLVEPGATLVLEDSVTVDVVGNVRVRAGGTLRVQPGAQLRLGAGAVLQVEGLLVADDAQVGPISAVDGWGGLRLVGAGRVSSAERREALTR